MGLINFNLFTILENKDELISCFVVGGCCQEQMGTAQRMKIWNPWSCDFSRKG
jgi:hypothetical protein